MVDFTNNIKTNSTPELTSEIAQGIYSLIKTHGNADLAFKNQDASEYDASHFKLVDKEIDRLYAFMNKLLSGKYKIADAEYDEEGNEITPVQYYVLTTETDFKNQLSSDLLDTDLVYTDFKNGKTWAQLKSDNEE